VSHEAAAGSREGEAHLGDAFFQRLYRAAELVAHVDHPPVFRQDETVDLLKTLLMSYTDHHIDELESEPLALEAIMDDHGKLTLFRSGSMISLPIPMMLRLSPSFTSATMAISLS